MQFDQILTHLVEFPQRQGFDTKDLQEAKALLHHLDRKGKYD